MKHPEINDIIHKYTAGEASLEETNAALKETGSGLQLDPARNLFSAEELLATRGGETAAEADGWGLLDTGTGSMEKVEVTGGKLAEPINEVLADGSTNMLAYVLIGGKRYEVKGDALADC